MPRLSSCLKRVIKLLLISRIFDWLRYVSLVHPPDSFLSRIDSNQYIQLRSGFRRDNLINNSGDDPRLWSLILNIEYLIDQDIPGAFVEVGVWKGSTAFILSHYAALSERKVFLYDTFTGFDPRDFSGVDVGRDLLFSDSGEAFVKSRLEQFKPYVELISGFFPESISTEACDYSYAFVSVDCDLYKPIKADLKYFYPLLTPGGMIFVHDYSSGHWPGARVAVNEFCLANKLYPVLLPDMSGTVVIRKQSDIFTCSP
jgi:hypothetical protein